jgi:hypothetical protein
VRRALSVQLFLAVFGVCLSGCHNSTAPSATVGGDYRADQFVTTGSSGQTNQIVAGSSLYLYLAGNGTVSGQLNMAASGGNPAFAADMTGTWMRSGNTITFSQAADTFVRNMTFALEPNGNSWQFVGDQVISGTRIQIRLSYFVTVE